MAVLADTLPLDHSPSGIVTGTRIRVTYTDGSHVHYQLANFGGSAAGAAIDTAVVAHGAITNIDLELMSS